VFERGIVTGYVALQVKRELVPPKNITGIASHAEFDNDKIADAHDEGIVVRRSGAVQI
jgi:hypothetical protein